MTSQPTVDTLKKMHFSAMARELENQLSDPDTYNSLGFEERIGLLVDAEWNRRQANKLAKCIRDAGFSASNACIEEIEYHPDRKLDANCGPQRPLVRWPAATVRPGGQG